MNSKSNAELATGSTAPLDELLYELQEKIDAAILSANGHFGFEADRYLAHKIGNRVIDAIASDIAVLRLHAASRLEAISEAEPVAWMVKGASKHSTKVYTHDTESGALAVAADWRNAGWSVSVTPLFAHTPPAGHVVVPVERLTTVLDEYDAQTKALPLGHEDRTRGASSYNWRRSVIDDLRAMLAALPHNQGGAP